MKLRTSLVSSFVMNFDSKELYINMGNDIPLWNDLYSYEEQDDDVKQFWENEAMKLLNGVTINGVFIHPWLYWHINFWKMMIDVGDDRIPGNSQLRDNEWMFAEFLKQAEEENKGIFMFGCRRFGKALLDSEILYLEDREKMIGNIVVGDKIYDDKGNLVEVVGVYPQGKVTTYRVVFEDGRNVICCGNHQWRVNHGGKWHVRSLRAIAGLDYKSMSIPVGEALNYPTAKLPVPPSAYASMLVAYLGGYSGDMFFDKYICKKFLRSSIDQKKDFIENFIRSFRNVVTGEEELTLSHIDMDVINFVQRMFWASGWYAKLEGNKLILSRNRKELKIRSISIYGKEHATCITVDNDSHLFLTTNYIVTHNTAIMSSLLARNATMTYNLTHNVIGASKEDLANMGEYLEFGLDNLPPYLTINRTGNDWTKEVVLGTRNINNQRDVHARIRITNVDDGKTRGSLKTAGGTPYTSIYDEVGKFPVLGAWLAGRPAHMMHGRMRGVCLMAGCCCAGTIVYKSNGEPCRIEDLKQEDGIIGFDVENHKIISQNIEWIKPPSFKSCFRITTKSNRTLECSFDHPIKCEYPNGRDILYDGYVSASKLIKGDAIWTIDNNGNKLLDYVDSIDSIGERKVYNLTASDTHTYIANGIITHNTGGNVEKSQDAQKIMNSPDEYGFIIMNYDILNKRVIKPTWRICKSGCFVPAQMSHAYEKKETTLDKYLGVESAPGLKKIKIKVSDFDKNTGIIKSRLDELVKKDRALYVQERMAFPLSIDDCFLNTNVNRFPVEDALKHKSRLLEEGRPGKTVDIYQIDGMKMGYNFSDKQLADYPFQGGNIDSPVVIYEDPPEEGGVFDYTYVSSLDPYKSDKADTDSVGSFYVLKRYVKINDPFAYCIVASYASRPPSSDDFCRNCEILQEAYGAKCLMENADRMYEFYLTRRNKQLMLLEDGERLAGKIIRAGARQNNKLGLAPTVPNQRMLFNTVIQYCWEDVVVGYDDDGNEITQKGIYRIPDIELLDEIIAFGPGTNTDRIISFGHALLLAKYYDDMGYMPESTTQKENQKKRERKKIEQVKGFTVRRHNPYKMR
ncbi:MAG: Hom-end-associated Hint [Bacteriophage sp.]|nr:MAG: Hom-end-associated Hint [Bacteriophage sp.]